MARTKQTTRRSTGGKAPRKALASVSCSWDYSPSYYNYGKRLPNRRSPSIDSTASEEYTSSTKGTFYKESGPSTAPAPPVSLPIISGSTDSAAQRAVLSSPDLLLIILSQLPHSSLLKTQSVNKIWASLFDHVEIQAALFQKPRPRGAAAYVEPYSDILKNRFEVFWPAPGKDRARFGLDSKTQRFHPEGWRGIPTTPPPPGRDRHHGLTERRYEKVCPHRNKWGQILVSQPAVKSFELVREIDGNEATLESRSIIPRPNGLRMGFLLDAVRHWNELEIRDVSLLWGRKTGDLIEPSDFYLCGSGFKTDDDKPCVTMWVHSLNYDDEDELRHQVIESEGEKVSYSMSESKLVRDDGWGE
ncbi:hypothetical protein NLG97_g3255 [Lecanicillium saksenae]|uniref:Uncharacterized protein n=1 Tax=Lecanicillium saksenae TaxID=468837 RepID=A0ACC1QYP5_9HYPO|nr:hypothetical protein NLG97_g3255 [Lecanicillium saksenae]